MPATRLRMLLIVCAASTLAGPAFAGPECGVASWYRGGQRHVAGQPLDKDAMHAAHRTLPLGTRVQVRNTKNGQAVTVHITERGPFRRGRIIDVSEDAGKALGMDGVAHVCVDEVK